MKVTVTYQVYVEVDDTRADEMESALLKTAYSLSPVATIEEVDREELDEDEE